MSEQVWVPHQDLVWAPGRLRRSQGDSCIYLTEDGAEVKIDNRRLDPVTADQLVGASNLVSLAVVTPAAVLHAVRTRYCRKEIYTNVARIVIAVNPYQSLPIYSKEEIDLYSRAADTLELSPHVFSVGANAFQGLREEQQNQAILVSGESGAGKTESTKFVLSYLAHVSGNDGNTVAAGIEEELLQTNPVLEAFGNAKTLRNDNSSRFGKWIEIVYHPSMRIIGSRIKDYLLEMPRICCPAPEERNFHIFYHLLAGNADPRLELTGNASDYRYLQTKSTVVDGIDDADLFEKLKISLAALQFSDEEQSDIFSIIAGILHLGNLEFEDSDEYEDDGSQLVCEEDALTVCRVLGLEVSALKRPLMWKRFVVSGEITDSPLNSRVAKAQRDALAKLMYGNLFKWLIRKLNLALNTEEMKSGEHFNYIGILDIAGFEQFEVNSLEQLFINLSNEALQQHFNTHIFAQELEDYKAEGIAVHDIDFQENSGCVELLSGKKGILALLENELYIPKATDRTYVDRVWSNFDGNEYMEKPRFTSSAQFSIVHFAGTVTYTVDGWLEKNCDNPSPCFQELLGNSSLSVLREISILRESTDMSKHDKLPSRAAHPTIATRTIKTMGKVKKIAVSQGFRSSLNDLMQKITASVPHFIRCIKPNMKKSSCTFESVMCMEQLMFSGVMEAVKIRQAGFPLRMKFKDFAQRYTCAVEQPHRSLLRKRTMSDAFANAKGIVESLLEVCRSDFAIGETKVLCRHNVQAVLEECRRTAHREALISIQAAAKAFVQRMFFLMAREAFRAINTWIDENNVAAFKTPEAASEARKHLEALSQQAKKCSPVPPNLVQAQSIAAIMELAYSCELATIQQVVNKPRVSGPIVNALADRAKRLAVQLPLVKTLEGLAIADSSKLPELEKVAEDCESVVPENDWVSGVNGFELLQAAKKRIVEIKSGALNEDDVSTTADGEDNPPTPSEGEPVTHAKGAGKSKGPAKGAPAPGKGAKGAPAPGNGAKGAPAPGKGAKGAPAPGKGAKGAPAPGKGAKGAPPVPDKKAEEAPPVPDNESKLAPPAPGGFTVVAPACQPTLGGSNEIAWVESLRIAMREYDVSTMEAIMREAPADCIPEDSLTHCKMTLKELDTESFLAGEIKRITHSSSGEIKRLHNLARQWTKVWHDRQCIETL